MNKSNFNCLLSLIRISYISARVTRDRRWTMTKLANQCAVRMNHDGHIGSSCCHRHQLDLWSVARRRQLKMCRIGCYGKTKNVVIDNKMALFRTLYYKFYVVLRYSICVLCSISLGRLQMVNWES
jgi:hypothetical protein